MPVARRKACIGRQERRQDARNVLGESFHPLSLDEPLHGATIGHGLLQIGLERILFRRPEHSREHLRSLRGEPSVHLCGLQRQNALRHGVARVFLCQDASVLVGLGLRLEHAEERTVWFSILVHRYLAVFNPDHIDRVLSEAHQRSVAFVLKLSDLLDFASEGIPERLKVCDSLLSVGDLCLLPVFSDLLGSLHSLDVVGLVEFDGRFVLLLMAKSDIFNRVSCRLDAGLKLADVVVQGVIKTHLLIGDLKLCRSCGSGEF